LFEETNPPFAKLPHRMNTIQEGQLIPLWPTWVGHATLPVCDEHNSVLMEMSRPWHSHLNLFDVEHPTIIWLKTHVHNALTQWFTRMGVQTLPELLLQARMDTLMYGEQRELQNAPRTYLSGVYFVNTPDVTPIQHLRSDCLPSHFSLLDPRVGFNALALVGDPNFNETLTVKPVGGNLMLWPAYLRHCSRVHLSEKPWVRVLFGAELACSSSN